MVFLCGFLPAVLIGYAICPAKYRNFFLFVASLFFYAWGEPRYIVIMLFSTVFDFCNGLLMEYLDRKGRPQYRKWVLVLSVVINIGILCFFKYTDFVLQSISQLTGNPAHLLKLALPIGISFYTFQTLSYTIDVYRREVEVQHNIIDFGMYVCLFPQLIAGPIVRYSDIQDQIKGRKGNWEERFYGVQRFILGLAKKVLLANNIGMVWTQIKAMDYSTISVATAWLGIIAFAFQIYFDFSGYSDMATGLGKMLGFEFPKNFDHPYISKSISEFWRRWHITLGSWFRSYVYIPLGGNRNGNFKTYRNLFITWALTGLWHGASWNFILWGLFFGVLIIIERLGFGKILEKLPSAVSMLYTFVMVLFGWVLFDTDTLADAGRYYAAMFGAGGSLVDSYARYTIASNAVMLTLCILISGGLGSRLISFCEEKNKRASAVAGVAVKIGGLLICTAYLVGATYNPFLYFRF